MATISELNFKFLREIKNNNNRNWFAQNKSVYQQHQDLLVSFAEKMMVRLNEHDIIHLYSYGINFYDMTKTLYLSYAL